MVSVPEAVVVTIMVLAVFDGIFVCRARRNGCASEVWAGFGGFSAMIGAFISRAPL